MCPAVPWVFGLKALECFCGGRVFVLGGEPQKSFFFFLFPSKPPKGCPKTRHICVTISPLDRQAFALTARNCPVLRVTWPFSLGKCACHTSTRARKQVDSNAGPMSSTAISLTGASAWLVSIRHVLNRLEMGHVSDIFKGVVPFWGLVEREAKGKPTVLFWGGRF